jgi:phosphatidylglycerophosphatase A
MTHDSPAQVSSSADVNAAPATGVAPARATAAFMFGHPARLVALGFGSGLAPKAPGTAGTLLAWALFVALDPWLGSLAWAVVIALSIVIGAAACTRCARDLGSADPSAIVWDEVVAFWLVLWLLMPASWLWQLAAFGLFRFFDAVKPGPVAWADRLFKDHRASGAAIGWRQGVGILFDDLVAALCTLVVLAIGRWAIG